MNILKINSSSNRTTSTSRKYVDELMCLICDIEFHIVVEALNHVKKEHLDLIEITEKQSEIIQKSQVKEKFNANKAAKLP